ncbi:MAG: tyrosine-type recombinase/integrase [Actinomycetota bacterium]
MARNNYVHAYELPVKKGGKPTGKTAKRYRAFWYDAAGTKHGKVFTVRRDAQAFIDGKTTDRGMGRLADHRAGAITIEAFYSDYMASNVDRWAETTTNIYALAWKHVPVDFRRTAVRDVTVPMVDAVLDGVRAAAMRQKLRQLLSGMFKVGVHEGRVAVSPVQPVGRKRTKKEMLAETASNRRALSVAELKTLVDSMAPRFKVLVELLGRVGLRPSEAYGLTVGQFDPMGRTLTIDRTLRGPGTKTGQGRVVPIAQDLVDKVALHIAQYSDPRDPTSFVFPTNIAGQPVNDNNLRRREWREAVDRSDLEPPTLTIYDLRHTACTNGVDAGIPIGVLASMTGHSVEMLLSTYYHPRANDDAARAAVERLAGIWGRTPEPKNAQAVPVA